MVGPSNVRKRGVTYHCITRAEYTAPIRAESGSFSGLAGSSFLIPECWLAWGRVRSLVHPGTVTARLCVLATWMPVCGWAGCYLGGTSSSAQSGGAPCMKVRV